VLQSVDNTTESTCEEAMIDGLFDRPGNKIMMMLRDQRKIIVERQLLERSLGAVDDIDLPIAISYRMQSVKVVEMARK